MRLVLASASPRRRTLLEQVGFHADEIRPADIDESVRPGEIPRQYVVRVASLKAAAVPVHPGEIVLAADTVVEVGRRVIGKPKDAVEAASILRRLSGRRHRVLTAIVVRNRRTARRKVVVTIVKMQRLGEGDIVRYIDSGEWIGKAGAYGIQGMAGSFIPWIRGSFTSVVGLPVAETCNLLVSCGMQPKPRN